MTFFVNEHNTEFLLHHATNGSLCSFSDVALNWSKKITKWSEDPCWQSPNQLFLGLNQGKDKYDWPRVAGILPPT